MGAFFIKQLHTLDKFSFSFLELNKVWRCKTRDGMAALQRFLVLNHRALDFLNVKAEIEMRGNIPHLTITTSEFAGSVPILSPNDGKTCGDLCIGGRFGEDVSELLSVLGETLLPHYNDSLPALTSSMLEPPLYFECCNFIDKWFYLEHSRWHKFDVKEQIRPYPTNGTRWDIYSMKSYEPNNTFRYPSRNSQIKPFHKEFCQLLSVLFFCFKEIKKPQTPMRSRVTYSYKISRLQAKYDKTLSVAPPEEFVIHASDPIAVKEAKNIANIILQNKRTNKRAWRIDYSEFFEKYVQYLFGEVAKKTMAKAINNPHYAVTGSRPTWALHYLEPDLILQKEDEQYVIDAKYKSHVFNWNDYSDDLRDTFRHDFHQIMAYCSFNSMQTKKAMLVYPFSDFVYHKIKVKSPLSHTDSQLYFVGIPLEKKKMEDAKEGLSQIVSFSGE